MAGKNRNNAETFWQRVSVGGQNDCWPYNGQHMKNGYGLYPIYGGKKLAHRMAYLFHYGVLEAKLFVLHSCDNRSCCNPNHLRQGTPKENTADMFLRNRQRGPDSYPKGSKCCRSKLTEEEVIQILDEYKDFNYQELADKYGVVDSNIEFIVKGKSWKHVPRPEHLRRAA